MSEGGGDWVRLEVKLVFRIGTFCEQLKSKVGGRIMATSRTTLTSCPSSVLAR